MITNKKRSQYIGDPSKTVNATKIIAILAKRYKINSSFLSSLPKFYNSKADTFEQTKKY